LIKQYSDYNLVIQSDDEAVFSDYLEVIICGQVIVNELRDDYLLTHYYRKFDDLSVLEMDEVIRMLPYRISDFSFENIEFQK
jgi:hypothetical protein